MRVFFTYDSAPKVNTSYLKPGVQYEVNKVEGQSFEIKRSELAKQLPDFWRSMMLFSDRPDEVHLFMFNKCPHLHGGSWIIANY